MFVSAIPVAYRPSFGDCQSDVAPAATKSCHIPRYDARASCLALSAGDKAKVGEGELGVGAASTEVAGAVFPVLHAARASIAAGTANNVVIRATRVLKVVPPVTSHLRYRGRSYVVIRTTSTPTTPTDCKGCKQLTLKSVWAHPRNLHSFGRCISLCGIDLGDTKCMISSFLGAT